MVAYVQPRYQSSGDQKEAERRSVRLCTEGGDDSVDKLGIKRCSAVTASHTDVRLLFNQRLTHRQLSQQAP